jgi:hypothetical protein
MCGMRGDEIFLSLAPVGWVDQKNAGYRHMPRPQHTKSCGSSQKFHPMTHRLPHQKIADIGLHIDAKKSVPMKLFRQNPSQFSYEQWALKETHCHRMTAG